MFTNVHITGGTIQQTLWWFKSLLWKPWPIEINDKHDKHDALPIKNMVIVHFATLNDQRLPWNFLRLITSFPRDELPFAIPDFET